MNYAAYKFSRGQFPAVQNYFQFQKAFKCLCHSTEGRFISAFQLQESLGLNCSVILYLYKGT